MASEEEPEAAQPPRRKRFTIPLEEAPPLEVKSLFKSSRSAPPSATSVREAPPTYADYTTAGLCSRGTRPEAAPQGARAEAGPQGARPEAAPQKVGAEAAAQKAQAEAALQGARPEAAPQKVGAEAAAQKAQAEAALQGARPEAAPNLGLPAGDTANQGPQGPKAPTKSSSITVSPRQRGNPVLKFIRNVPWEFGEIVPDYVMGQSTCALFLSLRYHNLHPNYIHDRLQGLGKNYALRVLLLQVDVKDPQRALKELAKMCILADCTLILAWSPEEAGRYLETYKSYEQKPADLLKEKLEQDFVSRVTECLTTVKSVNKTDSQTLLATFGVRLPLRCGPGSPLTLQSGLPRLLEPPLAGSPCLDGPAPISGFPPQSLEQLAAASQDDLALCPGFGPQKVREEGRPQNPLPGPIPSPDRGRVSGRARSGCGLPPWEQLGRGGEGRKNKQLDPAGPEPPFNGGGPTVNFFSRPAGSLKSYTSPS
ncbi:DNA excision repair protein ERCC-1 isoform 1-T2 [Sarcophilus harrisii]